LLESRVSLLSLCVTSAPVFAPEVIFGIVHPSLTAHVVLDFLGYLPRRLCRIVRSRVEKLPRAACSALGGDFHAVNAVASMIGSCVGAVRTVPWHERRRKGRASSASAPLRRRRLVAASRPGWLQAGGRASGLVTVGSASNPCTLSDTGVNRWRVCTPLVLAVPSGTQPAGRHRICGSAARLANSQSRYARHSRTDAPRSRP